MPLFFQQWFPENRDAPRAHVLIIHGYAEHSGTFLGGFAPGRPGLDAAEAAATPDLLPGPLVSGATPRPLPGPAPHPAFSTRIRPLPAPAAPTIVLIAAGAAETRETALAQAIAERDAAPFPEARPGDTA